MKSVKIAIVAGAITICAIIATVLIVSSGVGNYGLFITDFSGQVDITVTGQGSASAVNGAKLDKNSIVTVLADSYCKLTYVSKDNSKDNYIYLEPNSQIIISDDFDGKADKDIFLLQGTVINNSDKKAKANINVRTNSAYFTTGSSVSEIKVTKTDEGDITDFYCFKGNNSIQMFDVLGSEIEQLQHIVEKKKGCIKVKDSVPYFDYLNIDFELSDLSSYSLKELVAISNFIDDFTYSTAELRDAYKNAPEDEIVENPPVVPETTPDETTTPFEVTETSEYTVTLPPENVYVPPATTQATGETQAPSDSSGEHTTDSSIYHLVQIVIDGEAELQEVAHGGNAEQPADPVVDGLVFKGWDKSFENITEDTTITAIFENSNGSETTPNTSDMCTVTLSVAGRTTTMQVKYGTAASIPSTIEVPGYNFIGWDKDFSCVTSDMTVTAILTAQSLSHTVTFVIDNVSYPVTVNNGESAIPPYIPFMNSQGYNFVGWDKSLDNITSDTTITALFQSSNHTVTFIVNGIAYTQSVVDGASANPPKIDEYNNGGKKFLYWDQNFTYVTSDMTITAVFES